MVLLMSLSRVMIISTILYELIVPWKGELRFFKARYFFRTMARGFRNGCSVIFC